MQEHLTKGNNILTAGMNWDSAQKQEHDYGCPAFGIRDTGERVPSLLLFDEARIKLITMRSSERDILLVAIARPHTYAVMQRSPTSFVHVQQAASRRIKIFTHFSGWAPAVGAEKAEDASMNTVQVRSSCKNI